MIVKAKFAEHENLEIFHFCDILNDRTNGKKYASFEGSEISQNPCFYRLLGIKKTLLKSAFFRNSRSGKGVILVQNVKNQFLHQLSWRGVWIV